MSLGYFPNETLARQFGNNLGLRMVQSGLANWWSPLDIWRAAISESIRWEDGNLQTPLERLCPLSVRRSIEAAEAELRYLRLYGPDLNPIKKAFSK